MKVRFLAAAALCLILSAAVPLTVRAGSGQEEEPTEYIYKVSYVGYGSDGSYTVNEYTYTSNVPICFAQTKKGECYGPGGNKLNAYHIQMYYYLPSGRDTVRGVHRTGRVEYRKPDGSLKNELEVTDYEYAHPLPYYLGVGQGSCYYRFETDAPIFSSHDAALHYLTTGDASGAVNAPHEDGTYDETLPGVKNLHLSMISARDCHPNADFPESYNMCQHLRWELPEGAETSDEYEIKIKFDYNYTTYKGTKLKYGSAFLDYSKDLGRTVRIYSCAEDLCSYDLSTYPYLLDIPLNGDKDCVSSFTLENVRKVYIRTRRRNGTALSYGDWYVYTVNKDKTLSLDYNKQYLGEGQVVSGETNFTPDGEIPDGTEIKETIGAPERPESKPLFGIDFTDVLGTMSNFFGIIQNLIAVVGQFPTLIVTVFGYLPRELTNSIVLVFYMGIIVGLVKIFT